MQYLKRCNIFLKEISLSVSLQYMQFQARIPNLFFFKSNTKIMYNSEAQHRWCCHNDSFKNQTETAPPSCPDLLFFFSAREPSLFGWERGGRGVKSTLLPMGGGGGVTSPPRAIWKILGSDFFFLLFQRKNSQKNQIMHWDDQSFKPLLGLQIFFHLRRAKNITRIQKKYFDWNRLPQPPFEPQIFFRLRRTKTITRLQGMYFNWNRLPQPLGKSHPARKKSPPGRKMKFTSLKGGEQGVQNRMQKGCVNRTAKRGHFATLFRPFSNKIQNEKENTRVITKYFSKKGVWTGVWELNGRERISRFSKKKKNSPYKRLSTVWRQHNVRWGN